MTTLHEEAAEVVARMRVTMGYVQSTEANTLGQAARLIEKLVAENANLVRNWNILIEERNKDGVEIHRLRTVLKEAEKHHNSLVRVNSNGPYQVLADYHATRRDIYRKALEQGGE